MSEELKKAFLKQYQPEGKSNFQKKKKQKLIWISRRY